MRSDYTDITVVLDRSGSMWVMREEMEKAFNFFIEEQKKFSGKCLVTLNQFDNMYETIYTATPLDRVPKLVLEPRNATALWDAVGRSIRETGARLNKMDEEEKPAHVLMIIITDGQENSSHEFKKTQVRLMVEHQEGAYSWTFVYLGSAMTTFADAADLSFAHVSTYNAATTGHIARGLVAATNNLRSNSGFVGMKSDYTHDADAEDILDAQSGLVGGILSK